MKTLKALSYDDVCQLFADGRVRQGPFAELRYPQLASVGSAIFPKILGSYEAEIHEWIGEICRTDYSEIVDIGCAEGFYAIGLALQRPEATVYAYDADPYARQLCAEMANFNHVADRVVIREKFSGPDIAAIPIRRRGLVVCDCEGHEKHLFTESTVPLFVDWDLLIETHDLFDITISTRLAELFESSHDLRAMTSLDDIQKVKTYRFPELLDLDLVTRFTILAEYRPHTMEWFFLKSRTRSARLNALEGYGTPHT